MTLPADLLDHLVACSRLSRTEARWLVEEVLAYYRETCEEYVARRHAALRAEGHPNAAIYARVAAEVAARPVRGPALSERQVRRLIYG